MAKQWAECEGIETIVHSYSQFDESGRSVIIDVVELRQMIDELMEREEAIIAELRKSENALIELADLAEKLA